MRIRRTLPASNRYSVAGFSAIELMMVVSILSILTAIAVPSFTVLTETWRVRETADQLQSTLYYARSEAIRRGGHVVIQKTPNMTNGCSTAPNARDWDCGWIVCHDANGNGTCNANEAVLQRVGSAGKVHVNRTGGGTSITLNRWGLVSGTYLGFTLVPLEKTVSHVGARGVCMSSGGRIRVISQEAIPCVG
ncbi:GspH/FimT family pseudopilin [Acidovorax sp. sic0104]|uniref:GspH/FimT family pseudopilin n=1 Tax=Acidovorax sp. sic0104 TaxID=2854784 RepID=UPI001C467797|nr:GspH/FimT family pseudopilin [Acidovorax sp. sic0104]MBV7539554.1 GspH/FimT family pseudopilin [Acidovorax sp. sic0104]